MSRAKPGRPKAGEWRRAKTTALPTETYGYYVDIEFQCKKAQYSPKTKQDPDSGVHEGDQTLYLGAHIAAEFNLSEEAIVATALAEWQAEHPDCIIVSVGEPYRHYRGS